MQISANEYLMREHGALRRLLLIYRSIAYRIGVMNVPPHLYMTAREATDIVKQFIEEHHQLMEEEYVFPALADDKEFNRIIKTLAIQHQAAKSATGEILELLNRPNAVSNRAVSRIMKQYVKMYEPHAVWEDTVVLPAFYKNTEPLRFDGLGSEFEKIADNRFGKNGTEKVLGRISEIEERLGIHDLSWFTLKIE